MILPFSPVEFQEQDLELTKPLEVYEYFNPSCLSNGLLYSDPVDTVMSTELAFRIKYLSFLKENWDGNEAVSLSQSAIHNCFEFLKMLPNRYIQGIQKDDISATPYGTVVIDWNNNENLISVEIGNNSIGLFGVIRGNEFSKESINFDKNEISNELASLFMQFYS